MSVINGHTCIGDDGGTAGRVCEGCRAEIVSMAEELHATINEPMYAGTRQDWIYRAQAAEDKLARVEAELREERQIHIADLRTCADTMERLLQKNP